MVAIKLDLVLFLNIFYVSDCTRRIKGGAEVSTDKSYVVYLVKAPSSDKIYNAWVCGGAIVNSNFIITSAACVDDVQFMYAIAGYGKYVNDQEIATNECTKTKKKKIVYTCVPKQYNLEYDKLEMWSLIDIALVQVESPYDFQDQTYKQVCSYIPTSIPVNYETRFQEPGTDGLVLGWGHTNNWRRPDDSTNYNEKMLHYASVRIFDKEMCKQHYAKYENMENIIDKYMICTLEKGELDESGKIVPVDKPPVMLDGCTGRLRLLSNDNNEPCANDLTRRDVVKTNSTKDFNMNKNDSIIESKHINLTNRTSKSRKTGICQNDHGGPLVTWLGAKEVLIGVASVFQVSKDSKCMGPYLYTSTQCNGAFIDCLLSPTRRSICDSPPIQRGYDTVERHISWKNHPAGPADNEVLNDEKKLVVDKLSTKVEVPKAVGRFMELGKIAGIDKVAIRPQRPLN